MSVRLQVEVDALRDRVSTHDAVLAVTGREVAELKEQVEELTRLLQSMTRAATKEGKAA